MAKITVSPKANRDERFLKKEFMAMAFAKQS